MLLQGCPSDSLTGSRSPIGLLHNCESPETGLRGHKRQLGLPGRSAGHTCSPRGAYSRVKRSTLAWSFCFFAASRRLKISSRSLVLASCSTCRQNGSQQR